MAMKRAAQLYATRPKRREDLCRRHVEAASKDETLDMMGGPSTQQYQTFQAAHHHLDSSEGSLLEAGMEEECEAFPGGPPPEVPVWPAAPIVPPSASVATLEGYFQPAPLTTGTAGTPTVAELSHIPTAAETARQTSWATDQEESELEAQGDTEADTARNTDSDIANL